jgi:hypothetical protein
MDHAPSSAWAAIIAPTVSMLVIVVPIARSASAAGMRATLVSKHFSISVSLREVPAGTTGVTRQFVPGLRDADGHQNVI